MAKSGLGQIYKRRARSSCITGQNGFGHLYILVPGGNGAVVYPTKKKKPDLVTYTTSPFWTEAELYIQPRPNLATYTSSVLALEG